MMKLVQKYSIGHVRGAFRSLHACVPLLPLFEIHLNPKDSSG